MASVDERTPDSKTSPTPVPPTSPARTIPVENPATGAVLETAFSYPRDRAESPGMDLYMSVTGHATLPPDPYDH